MLASCLVKDDRAALLITFVLIILPIAIAPMFHYAGFSAFWALNAARDKIYLTLAPNDFWLPMAEQFALPFLYLLLASWRARATWREKPPTASGENRRAIWREWVAGSVEQRMTWRGAMLDENPALWLTCRRRERTALLWAVLGIGAVVLAWIWFDQRRIEPEMGMVASICFHWILKITFAFAACRALAEESKNGAFELLFTTSLTPTALWKGHLWGLARSFGVATAIILVTDALWVTFGRIESRFEANFRVFLWVRIVVLVADLAAIAVYGQWLGFKLQRSGRAAVRTLLLVVVLPNVVWILFLMGRNPYGIVVFLWLLLDAILIGIGFQKLKALRERAAERFVASSARE